MSNPDSSWQATGRSASAPRDDEVPVRTRLWCTIVMVPLASLMCVVQTSFASMQCSSDDPTYVWYVLSLFVGMAAGFLLLGRSEHPEATFWIACAAVAIFPFDSLVALMACTSLLARRSSRTITIRTIVVTTVVTLLSQLRDALSPADASVWHMIFARPYTGGDSGVPLEVLVDEPTIIITAIITALVETAIATLLGLHIRSRALMRAANAKADAATNQAQTLRFDLDNQQLADAIAAEAHDTLAHSLSLIALNASALQAESEKLSNCENCSEEYIKQQSNAIAEQARQIRRQAAGALDEAHSIIDMLRHPEQARVHLAPDDDTALTRESLSSLISDARVAGMTIDTWIDIRQLSELDDNIGKIAYRAIQEGLTNARRHASGAPVSLEVDAAPERNVHIHVSNPLPTTTATSAATGTAGTTSSADTTSTTSFDDVSTQPLGTTNSRYGGDIGDTVPMDTPYGNTPSPQGAPTTATGSATGAASDAGASPHTGAGLQGIAARARSVGGNCTYGSDDRNVFHLDVTLPWVSSTASQADA